MKNIKNEFRLIQSIWIIGLLSLSYIGFFVVPPVALANPFTFTTIDFPGSLVTNALGIADDDSIVGSYVDSNEIEHGFLLSQGVFTTIDVPGATLTQALGISNKGSIVGLYQTRTSEHGFLSKPLSFHLNFLRVSHTINFPGAKQTAALGVADKGSIVGVYLDANFGEHGFVASKGRTKK